MAQPSIAQIKIRISLARDREKAAADLSFRIYATARQLIVPRCRERQIIGRAAAQSLVHWSGALSLKKERGII
jgi:hypothetical protein